MSNVQMQEDQRVTIVGAVYKTVTTNGDAFQRQIKQKQLEEKRAEQVQRTQEVLQPEKSSQDVVELSTTASGRARSAQDSRATQSVEAPPPVEPTSSRGQSLDTVA